MKGRFLIPPALRPGHQYEHTNLVQNVKDMNREFKEHVKKNYNPKDPLFAKDEVYGKNINNLWTGYKLGGKGKLLVTGSMLGGGSIMAADPKGVQNSYNNQQIVNYDSDMQDVESLQSTRSDGMGYQTNTGSSQMVATSGDLVFAMHKTRHVGQM